MQDGCDPCGGRAALEQFFGDPFVGDAPIGLWEALDNAQALQPTAVDGLPQPLRQCSSTGVGAIQGHPQEE